MIRFTLNGALAEVEAPAGERLSETLRERLGKVGTKVGCDAGDCGACTADVPVALPVRLFSVILTPASAIIATTPSARFLSVA